MFGWVEAGFFEDVFPDAVGFVIEVCRFAIAWHVDGGIETLGGHFPDFSEELPRPFEGFLFEVVAEGPVAEHLEHCLVVGVEPDVLEVVVLTARTDTLLGVGSAAGGVRAGLLAKEDRHELVHAGVGEQQIRRGRHEAGRGHNGVLLFLKEI